MPSAIATRAWTACPPHTLQAHCPPATTEHKLPMHTVPHTYVRLTGDLAADLAVGAAAVAALLPVATATPRTPQPFSLLSVAQQCGGSDAVSGVSGHPCTGFACKTLIQLGGQVRRGCGGGAELQAGQREGRRGGGDGFVHALCSAPTQLQPAGRACGD